MSVFDFYVPQLDTDASGQLLNIAHLDASMVDIGTYDAAYKIDIKQSVAREMFRFSVYNSTVAIGDLLTDASNTTYSTIPPDADRDVGFYIQSQKFPTASPNYANSTYIGGSPAPLNPLLASTYVGHLSTKSFDDNNVVTIAQEYMSYVAKTLFTTAKATAIFNNESDFIKKTASQTPVVQYYKRLYDMSGEAVTDGLHINTLSATEITADTAKDIAETPLDSRSRNRLARSLFYSIANKDISRVTGILGTTMDAATRTYPIPVKEGDTFNSFVVIKKHVSQAAEVFGSDTTPILDRKYRIVLNIVADTETPVYDLPFQGVTNIKQGVSPTWTVAGIETLANVADAISLA
jgi:hypothetical protein